MNIYGSALPNGIILCSDHTEIKVIRTKDSNTKIDVKKLTTKQDSNIQKIVFKIPLLRGIINLLFYNASKAFKYCVLLMCILDFLKFNRYNSSTSIHFLLLLNLVLLLIVTYIVIKIRPILQYHAVEHKVVNTYQNNKEINYTNVKSESRVNYRCGTIFALFALFFFIIAYMFLHYVSISLLIAIAIAYELFPIESWEKRPILKYFYIVGGFLQEHFTTIEPKEEQIKLGIIAINELVKLNNEAQQ